MAYGKATTGETNETKQKEKQYGDKQVSQNSLISETAELAIVESNSMISCHKE